jgi:hypothetical protein
MEIKLYQFSGGGGRHLQVNPFHTVRVISSGPNTCTIPQRASVSVQL